MKTSERRELRQKSREELQQALQDAYEEIFRVRFQLATRQFTNHRRLRELRRNVARYKTFLREQELKKRG